MGIRQERPEEDRSEQDLRAFELDQRERVTDISNQYGQAMARLAQTANPILAEYQRDLERAVDDVQQGRSDKFDLRSPKLAEFAATVRDQAAQIGAAQGTLLAEQAARKAFVESPEIRRGLSADERKALPQASFNDLLAMAYNAGQRNAPQEAVRAVEKKAKEATGYEETLKRVRALTGTNGKAPRQPETKTTTVPSPEEKTARAERLAFGKDQYGNEATQADRDWLATQN